VKKKPAKVGESPVPYVAKPITLRAAVKTAAVGARQVDDAAFQKVADKIFAERKELLHKLAQ
jgi:hypothetical protein